MAALSNFLSGGHAAELILALVFCEFVLLWLRYRRGIGPAPSRWVSPLVAGAALVTALRLAQTNAPEEFVGLALAAAGIAHALGYRQRWTA